MPSKAAHKIPRGDWSARTAEIIELNFERLSSNAPLPVTQGGLGLKSFVIGDLLVADSVTTLTRLAAVAVAKALISQGVGVEPVWGQIDLTLHVTGVLPVANGGTGLSSGAQGDLLYFSAATTISKLNKDTNATRYLSNTGTSNNPAWAQVNLSNGVTGTLGVGAGGTGLTTYAVGDMIYASGTTTLARLAKATFTGSILQKSSGDIPQWGPVYPTTVALGTLIVGASSASYSRLDIGVGTTGTFLRRNSGAAFRLEWSTLVLPNAASQGQIPYASASNVLSMLAVGSADQVLTTQGAGADPQWKTLGSGLNVVTAASTITDNAVVRGDGGARGVQSSSVLIDDSDNVTGMATLTLPNTGLHLLDTDASHDLIIKPGTDLSADRTMTVLTPDADHTVNFGAGESYSVSWTSTGTAPVIGDGTLTGRYYRLGKLTFVTITLVWGSTTTGGTGAWIFSTPTTMLALATAQIAGGSTATDVSLGTVHGAFCRKQSTTGLFVYNINTQTIWTAAIPFTWAQSDVATITAWYETA